MKKVICKYCGSDEGFFIKTQIYGHADIYYNNDGTYSLNGLNASAHDSLTYKHGKNVYCSNCEKQIGKTYDPGFKVDF